MTDLSNPETMIAEGAPEAAEQSPNDTTASATSTGVVLSNDPSPVATALANTASATPIEADHETLGQEIKELANLTEDEVKRIVVWAKEKWAEAKTKLTTKAS